MKFFIKNKILSSIVLLFLIILTLSIIDMTSISTKYINKSTITFEVNNVRNPQLKKLVRFVDNTYSQIYFSLSKDQKKNLVSSDYIFDVNSWRLTNSGSRFGRGAFHLYSILGKNACIF